jgi:hypothetical protein
VKKAVKKKHELWKISKESGVQSDYEEYKKQRNRTSRILKKAHSQFEKEMVTSFKDNPKKFYSYIRGKQKVKIGINKLETHDGNFTSCDKESAQVLCNFFKSVFVNEDGGELPECPNRTNDTEGLEDLTISLDGITKKLRSLKEGSSPGPDNLHPKVLKECAEEIAYPVLKLFEKSLTESELPSVWKTAKVTPIFKKGKN